MQKVRAKFIVMENKPNDAIKPEDQGATITLFPVTGGSRENEEFYKWTPGGNILLSTINPDAAAQFVPGKSVYVDFIIAED
jgi:hypothetical protein